MLKLHKTLQETFPEKFKQVTKYLSATEDNYAVVNESTVSFTMQEGPIKEVGENGLQLTDLLCFCQEYLKILDKHHQCGENQRTLEAIQVAIRAQAERTIDRINRGVEGRSKD